MNDYNAFAQSQYPEKFTACCTSTRRSRIGRTMLSPKSTARIALGLKGLYYSQDFSRHGYARNLDHALSGRSGTSRGATGCRSFIERRQPRTTTGRATSPT